MRVPFIAETMSWNRFEEILPIRHFNDNSTYPTDRSFPAYNRVHKLRPLLDHLRNASKIAVEPGTSHAIDEMIIPFKDKHEMKV